MISTFRVGTLHADEIGCPILTLPRRIPPPAFRAAEELRPAEPHWHVDTVGVIPDRQGLGIGSALVKAGLAEADRAGVPAFLVTSDAPNVPFYEHLGFAVTEEFDIGPVHGWAMLCRPHTA